MRRCKTLLAGSVALAAALFGLPNAAVAAGKIHMPLASAPVTLSSTHLRQPLSAGDSVVLSWTALPELARHPWVDEWEAFLSFDGGETYPVRLTPHLDLGRRSFAIELPAVATQRARWMLRFGDEAREVEFEFPELFEIRRSRAHPSAARAGGSRKGRACAPGRSRCRGLGGGKSHWPRQPHDDGSAQRDRRRRRRAFGLSGIPRRHRRASDAANSGSQDFQPSHCRSFCFNLYGSCRIATRRRYRALSAAPAARTNEARPRSPELDPCPPRVRRGDRSNAVPRVASGAQASLWRIPW